MKVHGDDAVWYNYHIDGLAHWGRVMHKFVSKLTFIGWHNDLSPGHCEAIIWANVRIMLVEHLGTNFSEILIQIKHFHWRICILKVSSAKVAGILSQPQCVNEKQQYHNLCISHRYEEGKSVTITFPKNFGWLCIALCKSFWTGNSCVYSWSKTSKAYLNSLMMMFILYQNVFSDNLR